MSPSSLNREDPEAIRMVLQRLCRAGGSATLTFGPLRGDFRLLAETPDRVILARSDVERGQWSLKPGAKLTLALTDRGLPFEAVVEFQGHGRFHGVEASHVSLPRLLRATEAHRLADYIPDRPVPCSYADHHSNVRDGLLQAFGMDGVELAVPEALSELSEVLRLHAATTVEFHAAGGAHFVLPVSVAYLGDHYWGLRFPEGLDPHLLGRFRLWFQEARRAQGQVDLQAFDPGGVEARDTAPRDRAGPEPRLHADRDPLILVLAEGEAFPGRLAAAVGRKVGVASLDLARGDLRAHLTSLGAGPEAAWGRVRLILVHRSVRGGTALEVCRRLVQEEQCPLPILIAGTEDEADLKRNRAISAGAVDFCVVEPFNVLRVLRALDETLKLFE